MTLQVGFWPLTRVVLGRSSVTTASRRWRELSFPLTSCQEGLYFILSILSAISLSF